MGCNCVTEKVEEEIDDQHIQLLSNLNNLIYCLY